MKNTIVTQNWGNPGVRKGRKNHFGALGVLGAFGSSAGAALLGSAFAGVGGAIAGGIIGLAAGISTAKQQKNWPQ